MVMKLLAGTAKRVSFLRIVLIVLLQNAGPAEVALVEVPSSDFKNFRKKFLAQLFKMFPLASKDD